jgi:sarcosine oxidase
VGYQPREWDHIVVGAGAVGTSVAYHLSKNPGRTLVLERFFENHPYGSSHGRTRILRTAYSEGSVFVPLVLRARALWKRLAGEAGQEIFRPTGVLLAGREGSHRLAEARASAESQGLPHELLDNSQAARRFPAFQFRHGDSGLWDPGGGVLFPERAIRAYRRLAHAQGVVFRWNSPVTRWKARSGRRILVSTGSREYLAGDLVLTAGAWLSSLVPELHLPLRVEQQTVFWFRARDRRGPAFREMPAFVWYDSAGNYFYGTPDFGDGVKIGGSEGQYLRTLARRPRTTARELRSVRRFEAARLPGLSSRPVRQVRCLYTHTPDQNFIVDRHPDFPRVVVVSACSGHGFKFASALGEQIAKAVTTGENPPLLDPFRLSSHPRTGNSRPPAENSR